MQRLDRIIDLISDLNSEGTVESIYAALKELSCVLGLDRCVLRSRLASSNQFNVIAEWCADGLVPIDLLEPSMSSEASVHLTEQMLLTGDIQINDVLVSDFSTEEKSKAITWGCRSFLFIPLRYKNAINGMIVAMQSHSVRNWIHEDKQAVRLIGETALAVWLHNQSLQALSESRQQYEWALDASSDAIWDWDVASKTLSFSSRIHDLLGYDSSQSTIKLDHFLQHVHADDFIFLLQAMNTTKTYASSSNSIEFRIYTKQRNIIWLRSSGCVVKVDDKGRALRVVGTYSDITTFKQTLQHLELARENADRANKAKSEFLAKMSHEVRTPLNAIMGMLYLMKDDEVSDEQMKKLQIMQDSSQLLLTVLNDILDLSKIESGKLELECIPFVLEDVIRQVFAVLLNVADDKHLQFAVNIPTDIPMTVLGDPNRLSQILMNLISNAIKFTFQGQIVLSLIIKKKTDNQVTLEFAVHDSGVGIADEDMAVLFNSYAQAKKSIAREYGGTGLGLSICKSLVELMGGNIYADSQVGKGSVFKFNVDLDIPSHVNVIEKIPTEKFSNKKILLLCQNSALAKSYRSLFSSLHLPCEEHPLLNLDLNEVNHYLDSFDFIFMDSTWVDNAIQYYSAYLDRVLDKKNVYVASMSSIDAYQKLYPRLNNVEWLIKPILPSLLAKSLLGVVSLLSTDEIDQNDALIDLSFLASIHVLIVEDNAVNRLIAASILGRKGVVVTEMASPDLALEWLADPDNAMLVDVILMDIEMPVMSGHEAAMLIRNMPVASNIPILAMTANILKSEVDKCFSSGMNAYLSKPVDPDKLFATIMQLVKEKKQGLLKPNAESILMQIE